MQMKSQITWMIPTTNKIQTSKSPSQWPRLSKLRVKLFGTMMMKVIGGALANESKVWASLLSFSCQKRRISSDPCSVLIKSHLTSTRKIVVWYHRLTLSMTIPTQTTMFRANQFSVRPLSLPQRISRTQMTKKWQRPNQLDNFKRLNKISKWK